MPTPLARTHPPLDDPWGGRGLSNPIGWDTETHRIVPGLLVPRMVCATLAGYGEPPAWMPPPSADVIVERSEHGWRALLGRTPGIPCLAAMLHDQDVTSYAHNAAYDLAVLVRAGQEDLYPVVAEALLRAVFWALDEGRALDTAIREGLLAIAEDRFMYDPRLGRKRSSEEGEGRSYSLADTVEARFGIKLGDKTTQDVNTGKIKGDQAAWRLRYSELDGIPVTQWPIEAREYAILDAEWALWCAADQASPAVSDTGYPLVSEEGYVLDEAPQARAAWALHLMATWGPRVDLERFAAWREGVERKAAEGEAIAQAAGFLRPNGSKNMKALYALVEEGFRAQGRFAPMTRGSSKRAAVPQTGGDILVESGHPALVAYAESGTARKDLTTYVPILARGGTKPVTSRPNVLVRSGRISWSDPNLLNPPALPGFRECFEARPGMVYCSADYHAIELVGVSQVELWWFGHSAMGDAILAGRDLHLDLASYILEIPYEEAEARLASADPVMEEWRQLAKQANFGFNGGMGAKGFIAVCKGYGIVLDPDPDKALERAHFLRDAWMRRWEEKQLYFDVLSHSTQLSGTFTAIQPVSMRHRGGCSYTSGANTYFQGFIADGAKAAAYQLARECYLGEKPDGKPSPLVNVRPWAKLYDEVLSEGPEDADAWVDRKVEIMRDTMQAYIPDLPVKVDAKIMRRWYKKAKPVRNQEGRLIPWEPKNVGR